LPGKCYDYFYDHIKTFSLTSPGRHDKIGANLH
jgi:hypothetical protein